MSAHGNVFTVVPLTTERLVPIPTPQPTQHQAAPGGIARSTHCVTDFWNPTIREVQGADFVLSGTVAAGRGGLVVGTRRTETVGTLVDEGLTRGAGAANEDESSTGRSATTTDALPTSCRSIGPISTTANVASDHAAGATTAGADEMVVMVGAVDEVMTTGDPGHYSSAPTLAGNEDRKATRTHVSGIAADPHLLYETVTTDEIELRPTVPAH